MHNEGLGDPDPHGGTTVFAFIFAIAAVQTNTLVREEFRQVGDACAVCSPHREAEGS